MVFWNLLCKLVLLPLSQEPRPLSQSDLEKVLATSKKTGVAASEYSRLSSLSGRTRTESDEVQDAISEVISKFVASQIVNLQPDSQDS